ncbi:hypothetical protein D9M72_634580 [compost metagenome]
MTRAVEVFAAGRFRAFEIDQGDLLQILNRGSPPQHLLAVTDLHTPRHAERSAMGTEQLARIDAQRQFVELMPKGQQLLDGLFQCGGNRRIQRGAGQ